MRWNVLETAELDAFRENAGGSLAADLEAVLFSPAGLTVTAVRDDLNNNTLGALQKLSVTGWLDASGTRIASLQVLEAGARASLTAAASNDLAAARADGFRDLGILFAVLLVVTGLGLALRRSITVPLREVSEGARNLSSGKLAFDIGYSGRDEIGHVASAFHDLHVTVERLAGEIREMTAAVRDNRLGHRADVAAFEGTWSQLLAGVNDTMAAFADVEGRRERAERQLGDFFELSLDLLCIANLDGYFTRVNQAFERTLGFTNAELMSRPFIEFVHPDDRARTLEAFHTHKLGQDVSEFETRYLCSDGRVRWLQWSARAVLAEGLVYAVGRDVTERRRSEDQQTALRRVATLVAKGASPAETFAAITAEVGRVLGTDHTSLIRYDPDGEATVVGAWTSTGRRPPFGRWQPVSPGGRNIHTGTGRRAWTTRLRRHIGCAHIARWGGAGRCADHRGGPAVGRHECGVHARAAVAGGSEARLAVHRAGRHRRRQCTGAPGAARVRRRAGRAAAGGNAGRGRRPRSRCLPRSPPRSGDCSPPTAHGPLRPGRYVVGWSTTGERGVGPVGRLGGQPGHARVRDGPAGAGRRLQRRRPVRRFWSWRRPESVCRSVSRAGCGGHDGHGARAAVAPGDRGAAGRLHRAGRHRPRQRGEPGAADCVACPDRGRRRPGAPHRTGPARRRPAAAGLTGAASTSGAGGGATRSDRAGGAVRRTGRRSHHRLSTNCASSPAASIRRPSPRADWARRSRGWPAAPRSRSSWTYGSSGGCPSSSRPPPTTWSPRR